MYYIMYTNSFLREEKMLKATRFPLTLNKNFGFFVE